MKSFLDMLGYTPIEKSVMVVDALNLSFRYKHAGNFNFHESFVSTVKSLAKSYKADKIIITADKGSSVSRKAIFPDYKGNRKILQQNQSQEEADAFQAFLDGYEDAIKAASNYWPVLRYQGVEADDLAGYICSNKDRFGISSIWLISSDKDWDLLINENVSRFSFITRKETTAEQWPYEVERENFLLYKCLLGDAGDNIKGIDGIGEKRAAALANEYKTVEECISKVSSNKSKAKYIANLKAGADILRTNKILMDLVNEDHIKLEEYKSDINNIMENIWQEK